ncbi:MAG: hypothetical protein K9L79_17425 [Methylobacter tundripaludum]|nr:hypothetical protein [Methylobacter tundripaludum]
MDMSINGSGIRDTARVLKINKNTVISTLKKSGQHCPSKSELSGLKSKRKSSCESGIGL